MNIFVKLLTCGVPTIAAINGAAVAGGYLISLACDYRVMSADSGKVALNEILIGMILTKGATKLLQIKLGTKVSSEMILSGRMYNA